MEYKDDDILEIVPLSPGQEALWFMHRFAPQSLACHTGLTIHISAELDPGALRGAFQALVNRHACLRTLFSSGEDDVPVQHVYRYKEISFEQIDASEMDEKALKEEILAVRSRPFYPEQGPLFRTTLLSRSSEDYILLLTAHNLICDSTSLRIILDELPRLFAAVKAGEEILHSFEEYAYGDFIRSETEKFDSPEGRESLEYWKNILGGDLPLLNLPSDHPRPRIHSYNGATYAFDSDRVPAETLNTLAENENVPLSDIFLTAFQILLYRYTRQADILTGVVADRRPVGYENMVGCFADQIVLRSDFSAKPGFRDLLGQVRDALVHGRAHQNCPFPSIISTLQPNRDLSRPPVFQALFSWQEVGISWEPGWALSEITQYEGQSDLILDITAEKDRLRCAFRYNVSLR